MEGGRLDRKAKSVLEEPRGGRRGGVIGRCENVILECYLLD